MALDAVLELKKKKRGRRLNSGVSETERCRLGGTGCQSGWWRVMVVCATAMRISLPLMMVVVGWLVSYYVIVLVRGYAESTSCRGMARLAFAGWRLYVGCEWSRRARGHLFCTLDVYDMYC